MLFVAVFTTASSIVCEASMKHRDVISFCLDSFNHIKKQK